MVEGRPLHQRWHLSGQSRRTGASFDNVCRSCYPNSVVGAATESKEDYPEVFATLLLHAQIAQRRWSSTLARKFGYWSLIIESGDRFRKQRLAIGQRRSFGWIHIIGRRRRILL